MTGFGPQRFRKEYDKLHNKAKKLIFKKKNNNKIKIGT
jgi:hypothetical protein